MIVPLSKVYIDDEIKKKVLDTLDTGWFILGENVKEFEEKFARFCGVDHAVAVSSGTAAIFLTLLTYNIKPKDEVIVPSFSFIATASPVLNLNAKPIFIDINLNTYNIDDEKIEEKISDRTKAIMPVHLYGHPAKMDAIKDVAEKHDLIVIEDACQAHGAMYKKQTVGGIGDAACFSFYPSKNMTVCGDGGLITTNDEKIAQKLRQLRNHGRTDKYVHQMIGYNMRFNEIQAAIGIAQLKMLREWVDCRRKLAKLYTKKLKGIVITPHEEKWVNHVYYMYVIRSKKRDDLKKYLENKGISTGIHYPLPIHEQPAIVQLLGPQEKLVKTEQCAKEVLSLPMFPQLTNEQVEYVCEEILHFFGS